MRNRTMLGQKLISVSTCPTTITSTLRLTIVSGIRLLRMQSVISVNGYYISVL